VTAEAIRDGWSHTGDLGAADADGFITLVDLLKRSLRKQLPGATTAASR
jgi:fatty-acyl-CoA synthase